MNFEGAKDVSVLLPAGTEIGAKLSALTHNGKELVTSRVLGRGRYIMREAQQ
jgi:hypothetical protein